MKRVYSYLLNYALTVKGKKSLYYLNYIQRKYIKITSKSQNQTHFAVFRPSRREAGTTKSLLWLLGVRRAVRDQNRAHFNTLQTGGALMVTLSVSQESHGAQGITMPLNFPAAPDTFQQHVLSY